MNSSRQYSTSIIPSVRSVFQQVLDRAEMMEMSTVDRSAFVFLCHCFSLESEKCCAHVGVFKIIAPSCAPVCLSCEYACSHVPGPRPSASACGSSASVPSARSQPGQSNRGNRTVQLSGQRCCINEGNGRTWQPKHVKARGPGRASKVGPLHQLAGS